MNNLDKVYQEVADELGLSKTLVIEVAESQFSFAKDTIRAKEMKDIRFQYLGKFSVKPGRLKYLSDRSKQNIKEKTHEFDKFL